MFTKSNLISLFVLFISFLDLNSQNYDWVVKPIISEVDHIFLFSDSSNLVKVKKDKFFGVKTLQNKLVLPTAYESVILYGNDEIIRANENGKNIYFNSAGEKTSADLSSFNRSSNRNVDNANIKIIKELAEQIKGTYSIEVIGGRTVYSLLNREGRLIVSNITNPSNIEFLSNQVFIYKESTKNAYQFRNINGVIGEFSGCFYRNKIETNGIDLFIVENPKTRERVLFDAEFKRIIMKENIHLIDSSQYFIGEVAGQYSLYDKRFRKVNDLPASSFTILPNNKGIYLEYQSYTHYYDLITGTDQVLDFKIHKFNQSNQVGIANDGDGKFGIYSKENGSLISKLKFEECHLFSDYCICYPEKYQPKSPQLYHLFDDKGKLIYKDNSIGISRLEKSYFINKENKDHFIIDENGKKILDGAANFLLRPYDNLYWVKSNNIVGETNYYFVPELIKGKKVEYNSPGQKILDKRNHSITYFIVSQNEKWGLIDLECNQIIPYEFEAIEIQNEIKNVKDKPHSYLSVKKGELWGIIKLTHKN